MSASCPVIKATHLALRAAKALAGTVRSGDRLRRESAGGSGARRLRRVLRAGALLDALQDEVGGDVELPSVVILHVV